MALRHAPLITFSLVSLAVHLLLLFSWPAYPKRNEPENPIPVNVLPAPKVMPPESAPRPEKSRTRRSPPPARIAKRPTTPLEEAPHESLRPAVNERTEEGATYNKRESKERQEIVRRSLPNLKEILPPVTWDRHDAETGKDTGPVLLNTQERKYVSYFTSIKQAIQLVWDYPEPALRQGLEGKLVLEFTILGNGSLERTRLVRSSGFALLDEEAIRAVQAASPFHPIPPWIGRSRLDIIASFEYYDNRGKLLTP